MKYLAAVQEAKKREDEEKLQKTYEKMRKDQEQKQQQEQQQKPAKRKKVVLEEEEDSGDDHEEDEWERPPPSRSYQRAKKYQRCSSKKNKKDEEDYLALCKKTAPVFGGTNKEQCIKMYPLLGKKFKRSFHKSVNEIFRGSLKKYLTEDERNVFRNNKESVNMLLKDQDLKVNPFEEKIAPVARTVYGLVEEMEDADNKVGGTQDHDDSEWSAF